jgi:hypothetical protein
MGSSQTPDDDGRRSRNADELTVAGGAGTSAGPAEIRLPSMMLRLRTRPIRIRLQAGEDATTERRQFAEALRFGYGAHCDLRPGGESGPELVFELERANGPLRLRTPLEVDELENHALVSVDGRPLSRPVHDIAPGSRLEIVDQVTRKRYRLVVDSPPFWFVRSRFLALAMLILAVVGGCYGVYLYWALEGARTSVSEAHVRLARAESDVQRTEREVRAALSRIASAEGEIEQAMGDLKTVQEAADRELRQEFDARLDGITRRARDELSRLTERDDEARRSLEARARADVEALRGELSERLVDSYQRVKGVEERLLESLAARTAALEPAGDRFKRVLAAAREAVVLVHTEYQVKFLRSGQVETYNSFGTGFLVDETGTGLTAQHVLFPWRYERKFVVLEKLELMQIVPDSVRWSLWRTGAQVVGEGGDSPPDVGSAYRSDAEGRTVEFVYAPPITTAVELVSSPLGLVEVQFPVPDRSDSVVFRLTGPDGAFPYLRLGTEDAAGEPLDDVLAIGYPFSRLVDGKAVPQAVRGFVRRVGGAVMELDTSLHPGMSGGPVLDQAGRVIGMATAVVESDAYGMAVRGHDLAWVVEQANASPPAAPRIDTSRP